MQGFQQPTSLPTVPAIEMIVGPVSVFWLFNYTFYFHFFLREVFFLTNYKSSLKYILLATFSNRKQLIRLFVLECNWGYYKTKGVIHLVSCHFDGKVKKVLMAVC